MSTRGACTATPIPLSPLTARVLDAIDTLTASDGKAPTSGQVARTLGYPAANSIDRPLRALVGAGLIERPRQGHRGGLRRAPAPPPKRVDGANTAELDHLRQMADVLAWAVAEIEHLRRALAAASRSTWPARNTRREPDNDT